MPQGDALCPRLFTLCINPVAWKLSAAEGYQLSRPLSTSVTHILYIDDLKVFAASQSKLDRVLKSTQEAMQDIGLQWNPIKCSAVHVRKGAHVTDGEGVALNERNVIKNLEEEELYKFLGVLEGLKQEEQ